LQKLPSGELSWDWQGFRDSIAQGLNGILTDGAWRGGLPLLPGNIHPQVEHECHHR
jgi:hypothetical protein